MQRNALTGFMTMAALATVAACAGSRAADDEQSTESTTVFGAFGARPATTRDRSLPAGTVLELRAGQRITSASNHAGDAVTATLAAAALAPDGAIVLPAGTVFSGTITRIAESGSPRAPGTLVLAFNQLTIGATNFPVDVNVTSLGTHLDRAGVTTDDAAKVAVGAVVGGVAGRVISGNRRGTVIGAGAGAAGGAVYANQTRDRDIVLLGGARIDAVLTSPFARSVTTRD